jgi:hypothetical protein
MIMVAEDGIGEDPDTAEGFGLAHQGAKHLLFTVLQDKPPLNDPRDTMIKPRPIRLNPW